MKSSLNAVWLGFAALIAGLFITILVLISAVLFRQTGTAIAQVKNDIIQSEVATAATDERVVELNIALGFKEAQIDDLNNQLTALKTGITLATSLREKIASELLKSAPEINLVDPTTGDLRISSARVFDKDGLKDSARFDLRRILRSYLAILGSPTNRHYIDQITITAYAASEDAKKALDLSSKRGAAVLAFVNEMLNNDPDLASIIVSAATPYAKTSELKIHFHITEDAPKSLLLE